VADVSPKKKTTPQERIAQLVRQFGAPERGVRANAWRALEHAMKDFGVNWSDVGNWIERDNGKYTEEEMLEMVALVRKEEQARVPQSNGHTVLPEDSEMAEYCDAHRNRLEAKHHDFIGEVLVRTRRHSLTLKQRGYLASLYIQLGGRT
jgi:hypothetical protein